MVTRPGEVACVDLPAPALDRRDLLLEVVMTGVCGTDVHLAGDGAPLPGLQYPFGLGHEFVGRVAARGEAWPAADALGRTVVEGDRLVVHPRTWSCGGCYACRVLLAPNLCLRPPFPRPLPPSGALATHYVVPEGSTVFRVPDDLEDEVAVLVEPAAGALRALERAERAGFGPGGTLVVQGAGAIGALLCAFGRLLGAAEVIVIGAPDGRLEVCRRMGATAVLSVERTTAVERREAVLALTPHRLGVDAVVEAAGVPAAFVEALDLARPGGVVVEFGHYTDRGAAAVNPMTICRKDLAVLGARGHEPRHFARALSLFAAHRRDTPFRDLVCHAFGLGEVPAALDRTRAGLCTKAVVRP